MSRSRWPSTIRTALALLGLASTGCASILGIEEPETRAELGWTFDEGDEDWRVTGWDTGGMPEVGFEEEEEALELTIPFDAPNQQASVGVDTDWLDLTDRGFSASIRIVSGLDAALGSYPAYVRFYAQSEGYCDWESTDHTFLDATDEWFDVETGSVEIEGPDWAASGNTCEFDVTQVTQLGARISNAYDAPSPSSAILLLDDVIYD